MFIPPNASPSCELSCLITLSSLACARLIVLMGEGEGISTRRTGGISIRLPYWPAYLFICHFTHASRRGLLSSVTYLLNFCYLLSAFHSKSQDDVRARIVVRPTAGTKSSRRMPRVSQREATAFLSTLLRFHLLPSFLIFDCSGRNN